MRGYCSLMTFLFLFQTQFIFTIQFLPSFVGDASSLITLYDYLFKNEKRSEQLDTIMNSIESLDQKLGCFISTGFNFHDGKILMLRLVNLIKSKQSHEKILEYNSSIKSVCLDPSEGVEKMLAYLHFYFKKKTVLQAIRDCCHYKSECIDDWSDLLVYYSATLAFLVKKCEESSGLQAIFDADIFLAEVEAKIKYFKKNLLIQEFVNDTGNFGLSKSVLQPLKNYERDQISTLKKNLKKNYSFFDWDIGYSSGKKHAKYTIKNEIFCGSYVLEEKWRLIRTSYRYILIAWCLSNETSRNSNTLAFRNFKNKYSEAYLNDIIENSDNLNYAFCTGGFVYNIEGNSNYFHRSFYRKYISNSYDCIASNMMDKTPLSFKSLKDFKLTSTSIIFINKTKSTKDDEKIARYTNLRLLGHYLNINADTLADCLYKCKKDSSRCEAISYATVETRFFTTQCFLYDRSSVENEQNFVADPHWITYLKVDSIINRKIEKLTSSTVIKTCSLNNPCKEICKDEKNMQQKCYNQIRTDSIESSKVTDWGDWNDEEFCPKGKFAIGFNIKLEPYQSSDNTAMNGLQLICENKTFIQSGVGLRGSWGSDVYCHNSLLSGFRLRVEKPEPNQDDTATNSIEFSCANGQIISPLGHWENENVVWKSGGSWGDWSEWKYCPKNNFICGLQTQVEITAFWDITALNNIKIFCCRIQL